MSTCSVPQNQPIYQALLDKAASYPADKPYQAKAYKKAAESVAASTCNLYNSNESYPEMLPGIGLHIEPFIYNIINNSPKPSAPITPANWGTQSTETARKLAAKNAPNDVGVWPIDDAARATFQASLAASRVVETPTTSQENPMITSNYLNDAWHVEYMKKWRDEQSAARAEYLKTPVYTPENPRRSKRVAKMPQKKYYTEEDEQDEIAEAIKTVCTKKGWVYSDDLVAEFDVWFPTADKYTLEKYDWRAAKYILREKPDVAKYWAKYYSTSLQKQHQQQRLSKGLVKYCIKNNIEYEDEMSDKFAAWMADPANKKLITHTYSSYGGCSCSGCNPTAKALEIKEYSYDRSPTYCINKWFSTLKKTIHW